MNREELRASFQLTTPLFSGPADPVNSPAEIRVPSFKGVLRWWWRALAWDRFGHDLEVIHREESTVFGSATAGRSRVALRLENVRDASQTRQGHVLKSSGNAVGVGVRYLGYGIMDAFDGRNTEAGRLSRPCINAGASFDFVMGVRGLDDDQKHHLELAVIALGTMGGMGARSRRGFGSLSLQKLEWRGSNLPPTTFKSPADLAAAVSAIVPPRDDNADDPRYTAVSGLTRAVVLLDPGGRPLEALDLVGQQMLSYRSYGRDGKLPIKDSSGMPRDSERNFEDDHDLMQFAHNTQVTAHPRRVVFGLPHNYYFSGGGKSDVVPSERGLDRRGSPLLIHIHATESGPAVVVTVLPSEFLPGDGPQLQVGSNPNVDLDTTADFWQPLYGFLDRCSAAFTVVDGAPA